MPSPLTRTLVAFTHTNNQDVQQLIPIQLPCPRTGHAAMYLHDTHLARLYELQRVVGPGRKACWLIDDQLHKDGSTQFISPIDPLFIALPLLRRAREQSEGKFRTADDIFSSHDNMETGRLLDLPNFEAQLAHLCDTRDVSPELRAYRLSDEMALAWLAKKVERLVPAIPAVMADDDELKDDEKQDVYRQEAAYLLAKYLSDSQLKSLLDHLSVQEIKEETPADIAGYFVDNTSSYFSSAAAAPSTKATEDAPAAKKKPETPRSLAKVNTRGMKPLTSFFQKK